MGVILLTLGILLFGASVYSNENREDFEVLYDQTFNLTCDGSNFNISAMLPNEQPRYYFWVTPNGDYLGTSPDVKWENSRVVIGGTSTNYGRILTIKKVDDLDFGVYNCMIETYMQKYKLAVQKGINVDGAYYGDLLLKYRMNIIIGVCAGGGLLVLCIVSCLIYHLRYRHNDDEESDEEKLNGKINAMHGYDNAVVDDEKASTSSDQSANANVEIHEKRPISDAEIDTKL